jgi:predicted TIM-barrel enzyme
MPGKFRKRSIERKGSKKEQEKDMIMLDKNKSSLAKPEVTNKEFDEETAPVEEGEVESGIIGPKEGV